MAKVKTVNYTPAQTAEIVSAYVSAKTDEDRKAVVSMFAEKLGKGTRSIIAKLSREGCYQPVTYKTKTGGKAVTKAALVTELAKVIGCTEDRLTGMENATKGALNAVLAFAKTCKG